MNINVDSQQEAAIIFECLNDRGLPLTVADLLRNLLFIHTDERRHEELRDDWEKLLEYFKDDNLPGFLRYSWMSRRGEVRKTATYDTIQKAIRDGNLTAPEMMRQLLADSQSYDQIVHPRNIPAEGHRNGNDCGACSLNSIF